VLDLGKRGHRRRDDLEERANPKRGVAKEEVNYRIDGTRLDLEQSPEVGEEFCGHLLAGEQCCS